MMYAFPACVSAALGPWRNNVRHFNNVTVAVSPSAGCVPMGTHGDPAFAEDLGWSSNNRVG